MHVTEKKHAWIGRYFESAIQKRTLRKKQNYQVLLLVPDLLFLMLIYDLETVQTSLPLRCLRIDVEAELGGDHHPPSEWRERLANQFLVDERTVDLGGVKKRDAPVNGRPDQADHLLLVRSWAVMALMPMQPSPRADTSRLLFPSLRFCIVSSSECHAGCSDLRDAMSMEKRYLTSDLTSLS